MKITIDIKYLAGAILFYILTWGMFQGKVQEHIHFQGVANEIFFTALTLIMASGLTLASIEFPKKKNHE